MNISSPFLRKFLLVRFLASPLLSTLSFPSSRLSILIHRHNQANLVLNPSRRRTLHPQILQLPFSQIISSQSASSKMSTTTDNNDIDESKPSPQKVLKGAEASDDDKKVAPKKKKASPKTKKKAATTTKKAKAKSSTSVDDDEDADTKPKSKKKKAATTKKRKTKSSASDNEDSTTSTSAAKKKSPAKKKKAADHQRWTERTPLTRHWNPQQAMQSNGSYTFTIISWNVAGLRAFVKKQPDALSNLVNQYHADVICLQETKLQENHLDDPKLKLREYFDEKLPEYDSYWSYSTTKKGYSGVATFVRKRGDSSISADGKKPSKKQATLGAFFKPTKGTAKKSDASADNYDGHAIGDIPIDQLQPIKVETELGLPAHDGEGRTITVEYPLFYLTNVYVPNSGQKLDRLGYRTEQWDSDFLAKHQQLEKEGNKPVIWLGDLNVAHNEKDTWNEGAKHLAKGAGTTAEERASFDRQLSAGYVDAFRHLHPEGRGHYSYWSQRAGNREPNKGLRLDYFICSQELMEDGDGKNAVVRDSYMLPDFEGSDHGPVVLEVEIKK